MLENGYNIPINKALIDRFKLWIEQKEKCIYTGAKIEFKDLLNRNSELNIDHIIPQSIILDDTLSNKVLTFTNVNAVKTDRIPMQCLDLLIHNGCSYNVKQYKDNIKKLGLSKKKTQYLLLDELSDDVVDGFVSRNINDTRYITRYITNYLKSAFDESGLNIEVNAIKGSVTSTYRKKWLTKYDTKKGLVPSIYALDEKGRNLHYYHHAIDACILANIKKEYIVLSGFIDTILNINRDKRLTQTNKTIEINKITEKAVKTMTEHYHMSEDYVRKVIKYNRIPSVCKNLYEEIPLRVPLEFIFKEDTSLYEFINDKKKYRKLMHYVKELKLNSENHELFDNEIAKEFNELIKHFELPCHIDLENNSYYEKELCININDSKLFKSNGFKEKELKDYLENIKMVDSKTYKDNCLMYYKDNLLDNDFINNINIQYIQFMKERKFSGRMVGSDVPVSLDKALEETNKALNKRNKGCGKIINNFIEFEDYLNDPYNIKPAVNYYIKWNNKGNNNYSIYNAQKYYCAEQYSSTDGHVYIRGIRYFDILNKNGHLYLKKPLPEGYQHICYLFTNDCISVFNKSGKLKSNGFGFYKSIDSANQNTVIMRLFNNKKISNSDVILKLNDSFIKKYELDCFGHIEGEIKCGDQSLFTIEKQ